MNKILILGGTSFIGRNLVERLINNEENDLTLLNRGATNTHLFPEQKKIVCDRNSVHIVDKIEGDWDYIIDVSCYFPRSLDRILKATSKNLKKYIFVSTCSVYENTDRVLKDETAPVVSFLKMILKISRRQRTGNGKQPAKQF